MKSIRVVVIENMLSVLDAYCAYLSSRKDISVVGKAQEAGAGVSVAMERNPDVVVMDLAMPGMDGIEAARNLRSLRTKAKVLLLSERDEPHLLRAMYQAGANGLVHKNSRICDVVAAIRSLACGNFCVCGRIAPAMFVAEAECRAADALSSQQKNIFEISTSGKDDKEIAEVLGINKSTVASHFDRMKQKLSARNRCQLVRLVIEQGLL